MIRALRNPMSMVFVGISVVATLAATAQSAIIQTYSFQEGVNGYTGTRDTHVGGDNRGAEAFTPHGNSPTLPVYEREVSLNNFYRALIGFDLSSFSSPYDISSATLTLWTSNQTGATNIPNSLYAISSANGDWTEGESTWNFKQQTLTTPWAGSAGLSTANTDYLTPALAPTEVTPVVDTAMTFTLNAAGLAMLQSWVDNPLTNTGFFLRQPDNTFTIDSFYSSEAANAAFHPLLTISVTVPPAPEPSSLALLGMGALGVVRRRRAMKTDVKSQVA